MLITAGIERVKQNAKHWFEAKQKHSNTAFSPYYILSISVELQRRSEGLKERNSQRFACYCFVCHFAKKSVVW